MADQSGRVARYPPRVLPSREKQMTKEESVSVSREGLLRVLQALRPGLAAKGDMVDSFSVFAFRGGRAYAYNGEILCRSRVPVPKDLEGSAPAGELLDVLGRLPADEVDLSWGEGSLTIRARRIKIDLPMDSSFDVPIDDLPKPDGYSPLPPDFPDAIEVVRASAGDVQEAPFTFKCVHLTPKFIESCDQFRMTRYALELPVTKTHLVLADRFKQIGPLGMTEMAETAGWLHFRNPSGVLAAVRTQDVEYPDLTDMVEAKGVKMALPKGLITTSKVAEAVLGGRKEDLYITLGGGWMKVTASASRGARMSERRRVDYDGPEIRLALKPPVLAEIANLSPECVVNERFLKIDAGRYVFVASVAPAKKNSGGGRAEDDGEQD